MCVVLIDQWIPLLGALILITLLVITYKEGKRSNKDQR